MEDMSHNKEVGRGFFPFHIRRDFRGWTIHFSFFVEVFTGGIWSCTYIRGQNGPEVEQSSLVFTRGCMPSSCTI